MEQQGRSPFYIYIYIVSSNAKPRFSKGFFLPPHCVDAHRGPFTPTPQKKAEPGSDR